MAQHDQPAACHHTERDRVPHRRNLSRQTGTGHPHLWSHASPALPHPEESLMFDIYVYYMDAMHNGGVALIVTTAIVACAGVVCVHVLTRDDPPEGAPGAWPD